MLTLTESDLLEITGYKRSKDQARTFNKLGVPYVFRRDGSLSVARAHYENAAKTHAELPTPKLRTKAA